ncbi:MAG: shikimate kinase [Deltaproteobacteria bacterium]|nr:shikimate kinase [Deltaproteobacteria bacterium]
MSRQGFKEKMGKTTVRPKDANIVLIGMPAVGKSTIGVLLAKATSRDFIDTDVYIQAREGRSLQEIIDREGLEEFCRIEARHVFSLSCRGKVMATGGSVVYSKEAMKYLGSCGVMVHLTLDLPAIKKRLTNLDSRGVVMAPGKTLDLLYEERLPLYRQYADFTVNCRRKNHEEIVAEIIRMLKIP